MNHYEEKQERRRQRYLDQADKNEAASSTAHQASRNATAGIPFGQPILVGHHSEKRHRRALERSDNAMSRAVDHSDKAAYYRGKAAGVGKAGISSDDPEAVTKLQAKIDGAQAWQKKMKACNSIIRARDHDDNKVYRLKTEQGLSEGAAWKLLKPDFCGRLGFPRYELTNNNANIRRMKQRIEQLRSAPTETTEQQHGDITVVQNADENRVQIIFPGKPPAEVRAILKAHGFRWSPYNTAWQRHLNNASIYAAGSALTEIKARNVT